MPAYMAWLRQHVGHQKVISTGAAAVIRDAQGRILLQKRRDVGLWGFPGGGQELGERIDETVRREAREEVGLEVEPRRIVGIYTSPSLDVTFPNGDQVQPFVVCFECAVAGGSLQKQESEVLVISWFALDDLPALTPLTDASVHDIRSDRREASFEPGVQGKGDGALPSYLAWIRNQVGNQKIILTGVAGMIRDEHGRVLSQRRRDNGLWGFPGGLQELGEAASDTLRREVHEEVGLRVKPKRLVGIYSSTEFDRVYPNGDESQMFMAFFDCELIGGELNKQDEEVLEVGWFDWDNLPPMLTCCAAKARDAQVFEGEAFFR